MKRFGSPLMFWGAALAFVLSACVQVYPPESQPSPAQQARPSNGGSNGQAKSPFKPYDEVLKDTEPIDGYFKFHKKRDNTLFLELTPEQLDSEFGLAMHYSQGIGDFNVIDGLYLTWEARLMRFERVGDQVLLVHENARFTADPGSPMRESLDGNVGNSILGSFKILSEQEETKNLVVNVTEFFVSDYADVARRLKRYYGNKPVRFDKKLSYVKGVMGFPENVEIDAMLTYRANDFPKIGGAGVSDYRSVPLGVRYSLFALPAEPMQPRLADDRVGFFLVATQDFSRDQKESAFVRYVRRWRLEKKDPMAEISEPVEPIVFYVDKTVPHEYRKYVKEGIEAWNKAYEAAGFKNAIVAKDPPEDDPTWSAEDIRYSTIRWSAAFRMGYAIGPSQTDPRTGEQLNADILVSSIFTRGWLFEWQEMVNPTAMINRFMEAEALQRSLSPEEAQYMCFAQLGKAHQLGVQYALLVGLGVLQPGEPMPEEYLGDAIRDLIMHEVGHTLTLRHNYKASSGTPYAQLQDKAFTLKNGVSVSVMDYNPVNVSPDRDKQGHYYNKELGSYDVWAIKYGYMPIYDGQATNGGAVSSGMPVTDPQAEVPALQKIASQGANPLHAYGSDEDRGFNPRNVDPLTSAWDLSSEPLNFARDRALLVAEVTPQLESRLIADGQGYQRLRGATSSLLFERFISLLPATKPVGGIYFNRDHKGDPGGRLPFTPVPAAKQREAVAFLVDQAFDEDAFEFNPTTLDKLAPNRWSHWGMGSPWPVDYPAHAIVLQIQSIILDLLLDPVRLQRIIDNELRTPTEAFEASELFGQLSTAIWSELGGQRARNVNSFRRNLQRAYTDRLIALMIEPQPEIPEDARSLARLQLKRLSTRIDRGVERGGLDDATLAHIDETNAQIQRALSAQLTLEVEEGN